MEYRLTLKNLPAEERPRERLCKYGPEVLSNAELLAIIIRTGNKNETALALAQRMLSEFGQDEGLSFLMDIAIEELTEIKGISLAKACAIKAAIELGKRIGGVKSTNKVFIRSPRDVADLLMNEMRYFKKEYFRTIQLNVKNQVLAVEDVSVGSLNASVVHPREVFQGPIRRSSAAIILVHNHPSGDPSPSKEDIDVTRRLFEAGKLLGIDVLDHIIIGDGIYTSLKEKGII